MTEQIENTRAVEEDVSSVEDAAEELEELALIPIAADDEKSSTDAVQKDVATSTPTVDVAADKSDVLFDDECTEEEMRRKVFVGGLNWETTTDSLREYMMQFGAITKCEVMYDPHSGKSRGFGFVVFEEEEVAEKLMAKDTGIKYMLDGRTIDPKRALPRTNTPRRKVYESNDIMRRKIFVGGLPHDSTVDSVARFFSRYGLVEEVTLLADRDSHRQRGFGFVTFGSVDTVTALLAVQFVSFNGKKVEIKKAQPRASTKTLRIGRQPLPVPVLPVPMRTPVSQPVQVSVPMSTNMSMPYVDNVYPGGGYNLPAPVYVGAPQVQGWVPTGYAMPPLQVTPPMWAPSTVKGVPLASQGEVILVPHSMHHPPPHAHHS